MKPSKQRNIAEYAIDPLDERLIEGLQKHLVETYGEKRTRSKILRASTHRGLLEEIALAGPNKDGLYAGMYNGKELAELLRQSALTLADLQSRHTTPILSAASWPGMMMLAGNATANSNGAAPTPTGEANLDKQGAAAIKGLGAGLMKRNTAAPPPPPE